DLLLARLGPLGEPRHQAADAALEHVEEAVTPVRRAVDDDPDHVRLLLAAAPDAGRALGDRGAALGAQRLVEELAHRRVGPDAGGDVELVLGREELVVADGGSPRRAPAERANRVLGGGAHRGSLRGGRNYGCQTPIRSPNTAPK